MNALIDKHDFLGLEGCTWLYSGAETPPHRGTVEAVEAYFAARAGGPAGRERNAAVEQACKQNLARMFGGAPDQIALLSNSSEAISTIAQGLALQPGDNIVINTLEFPSGVLPWLAQQAGGVEVRVVPHDHWEVSIDDILERVDRRTRLVMTSHVSYLSGHRLDYRRLYRELKHSSTLLLLDVTQSLGAVPVDIHETDFLVCSSYKWLLGPHGAGILGLNPERTDGFASRSVGWRSVGDMFGAERFARYTLQPDARRFELGYPSYPTIYALEFSTGLLLRAGVERIERHILELGGYLIARLRELGFEVMTPSQPEKRAGNIAVVCPDGDGAADALRRQGILTWGGDGRLRASIHLFNDRQDLDRYTEALQSLRPRSD